MSVSNKKQQNETAAFNSSSSNKLKCDPNADFHTVHVGESQFNVLQRYQKLKAIGSGAQGMVGLKLFLFKKMFKCQYDIIIMCDACKNFEGFLFLFRFYKVNFCSTT